MADNLQDSTLLILNFVRELAPDVDFGATDDLLDVVGLSSVQVFDLVEKVEDHFDIAFPLNDLADIRTVSEMAAHVDGIVAH